ncbi:type II secretion system major pseudopilin GspG [Verrucomicrobiota bacterium]
MKTTRESAFTLIELMVVVIIIAALAGMVLPRLWTRGDDAKMKIAEGEIAGIKTALKCYYLDNGKFPTKDEGLNALMRKPPSAKDWKGPYLESEPFDPWDRPYQYTYPGVHNVGFLDIWSFGPNEEDNSDNVTNWKE